MTLALAACGGGGGGSASGGGGAVPTPAPTGTSTTPGTLMTTGPITFAVTIPNAQIGTAAKTRSPNYISTAIQSIDFRLTAVVPAGTGVYNGALNTDTLVAVAANSPTCALAANGDNTCTATAIAPAPATDTFTVYTYAVANPVIGTTVPLSVYAGYSLGVTVAGPNTAAVATNGVPASIAFSPAVVDNVPGATALSGPTALSTSLIVKDAGGAALIGSSPFASPSGQLGPVVMRGCDPDLTPTPATISAGTPAALGTGTISVGYDGKLTAGTIHCYAIAPGGLATQFTVNLAGTNSGGGITIIIPAAAPVICTPSPVPTNVNQYIVISCTSAGYTGAITWSVADPTIASVQVAAGTYTLFYVSGLKAGTTTLSLATLSGGAGSVAITVSP